MDRAALTDYIRDGMAGEHVDMLISEMAGKLSDDQLRDCLAAVFKRICEDKVDTKAVIRGTMENAWYDMDCLMYYEDDDSLKVPDIAGPLRDAFCFVPAMVHADLVEEAAEFCTRIADGLGEMCADGKCGPYKEFFAKQRESLLGCIEKRDYTSWFDYRSPSATLISRFSMVGAMITIIGTGHVFNLAEPVSFIVKNTWPDAVLVELDMGRYNTLMSKQEGSESDKEPEMSSIYRQTAKYQERMSKENGATVGGEFLAAINTGKLVGAEIVPIDTDAMKVLNDMWDEMSAKERLRYKLSGISDSIGGNKKIKKAQNNFAMDEEAYIEGMRRKYPTLVKKLIDERNASMADQINQASTRFENMVVVVGDAHVEGLCRLIEDPVIRKIRLADLMDKERMDKVRDMVWKGEETR